MISESTTSASIEPLTLCKTISQLEPWFLHISEKCEEDPLLRPSFVKGVSLVNETGFSMWVSNIGKVYSPRALCRVFERRNDKEAKKEISEFVKSSLRNVKNQVDREKIERFVNKTLEGFIEKHTIVSSVVDDTLDDVMNIVEENYNRRVISKWVDQLLRKFVRRKQLIRVHSQISVITSNWLKAFTLKKELEKYIRIEYVDQCVEETLRIKEHEHRQITLFSKDLLVRNLEAVLDRMVIRQFVSSVLDRYRKKREYINKLEDDEKKLLLESDLLRSQTKDLIKKRTVLDLEVRNQRIVHDKLRDDHERVVSDRYRENNDLKTKFEECNVQNLSLTNLFQELENEIEERRRLKGNDILLADQLKTKLGQRKTDVQQLTQKLGGLLTMRDGLKDDMSEMDRKKEELNTRLEEQKTNEEEMKESLIESSEVTIPDLEDEKKIMISKKRRQDINLKLKPFKTYNYWNEKTKAFDFDEDIQMVSANGCDSPSRYRTFHFWRETFGSPSTPPGGRKGNILLPPIIESGDVESSHDQPDEQESEHSKSSSSLAKKQTENETSEDLKTLRTEKEDVVIINKSQNEFLLSPDDLHYDSENDWRTVSRHNTDIEDEDDEIVIPLTQIVPSDLSITKLGRKDPKDEVDEHDDEEEDVILEEEEEGKDGSLLQTTRELMKETELPIFEDDEYLRERNLTVDERTDDTDDDDTEITTSVPLIVIRPEKTGETEEESEDDDDDDDDETDMCVQKLFYRELSTKPKKEEQEEDEFMSDRNLGINRLFNGGFRLSRSTSGQEEEDDDDDEYDDVNIGSDIQSLLSTRDEEYNWNEGIVVSDSPDPHDIMSKMKEGQDDEFLKSKKKKKDMLFRRKVLEHSPRDVVQKIEEGFATPEEISKPIIHENGDSGTKQEVDEDDQDYTPMTPRFFQFPEPDEEEIKRKQQQQQQQKSGDDEEEDNIIHESIDHEVLEKFEEDEDLQKIIAERSRSDIQRRKSFQKIIQVLPDESDTFYSTDYNFISNKREKEDRERLEKQTKILSSQIELKKKRKDLRKLLATVSKSSFCSDDEEEEEEKEIQIKNSHKKSKTIQSPQKREEEEEEHGEEEEEEIIIEKEEEVRKRSSSMKVEEEVVNELSQLLTHGTFHGRNYLSYVSSYDSEDLSEDEEDEDGLLYKSLHINKLFVSSSTSSPSYEPERRRSRPSSIIIPITFPKISKQQQIQQDDDDDDENNVSPVRERGRVVNLAKVQEVIRKSRERRNSCPTLLFLSTTAQQQQRMKKKKKDDDDVGNDIRRNVYNYFKKKQMKKQSERTVSPIARLHMNMTNRNRCYSTGSTPVSLDRSNSAFLEETHIIVNTSDSMTDYDDEEEEGEEEEEEISREEEGEGEDVREATSGATASSEEEVIKEGDEEKNEKTGSPVQVGGEEERRRPRNKLLFVNTSPRISITPTDDDDDDDENEARTENVIHEDDSKSDSCCSSPSYSGDEEHESNEDVDDESRVRRIILPNKQKLRLRRRIMRSEKGSRTRLLSPLSLHMSSLRKQVFGVGGQPAGAGGGRGRGGGDNSPTMGRIAPHSTPVFSPCDETTTSHVIDFAALTEAMFPAGEKRSDSEPEEDQCSTSEEEEGEDDDEFSEEEDEDQYLFISKLFDGEEQQGFNAYFEDEKEEEVDLFISGLYSEDEEDESHIEKGDLEDENLDDDDIEEEDDEDMHISQMYIEDTVVEEEKEEHLSSLFVQQEEQQEEDQEKGLCPFDDSEEEEKREEEILISQLHEREDDQVKEEEHKDEIDDLDDDLEEKEAKEEEKQVEKVTEKDDSDEPDEKVKEEMKTKAKEEEKREKEVERVVESDELDEDGQVKEELKMKSKEMTDKNTITDKIEEQEKEMFDKNTATEKIDKSDKFVSTEHQQDQEKEEKEEKQKEDDEVKTIRVTLFRRKRRKKKKKKKMLGKGKDEIQNGRKLSELMSLLQLNYEKFLMEKRNKRESCSYFEYY